MKNVKGLETKVAMRRLRGVRVTTLSAIAAAHVMCLPVAAQVSDEVLDSISTPNQVETPIGSLKFLNVGSYLDMFNVWLNAPRQRSRR